MVDLISAVIKRRRDICERGDRVNLNVVPAYFLATILAAFAACNAFGQSGEPVTLRNGRCIVTLMPASLEVKIQDAGRTQVTASLAQTGLGPVTNLKTSATEAEWEFADLKLRTEVRLTDDGLAVHFLSEKTGDITFPIMPESETTKGWILPMFEGVYVPRGDEKWAAFLTKQEDMSTTAELTMPFLGMDCGDCTMTCIITNAFNNTLRFEESPAKSLQAKLTHQFTRNHPVKECGFLFVMGTNSPVEPAKVYRRWLVQRGEFVTMADKIKRTPEAAKLAGAAQIYLWGSDLIAPNDVLNWKKFVIDLKAQSELETSSPGKRIWKLMKPEARKFVDALTKVEWPDKYSERQVTEDLTRILRDKELYEKSFWNGIALDAETKAVLKRDSTSWTQAEICHVNSRLLAGAFPGLLAHAEDWGDGICPKMIKELSRAGFDRLWLGSGSWDEFEQRPEIVEIAKKAGYLIGPYDSYN